MLEDRSTRFEKRSRRVRQEPVGSLQIAPQPASPIYFRVTLAYDLGVTKLEVTNRLLRIAHHHGLKLLHMRVMRKLITETRKEDLRREQTRRHLASDTSTRGYKVVLDASTREK